MGAPTLSLVESGSYVDPTDPGEACYGSRIPRQSVTTEEAEILAGLARGLTILEIGTGIGVSTRALASTAKEVVTVEIDPWVHEHIWPGLSELGNVRMFFDVPAESFDMVFIDADHRVAAVKNDIERTRPLCKQLMVLHDVIYASVKEALYAIFPEVEVLDTAHGLGIVRMHA